MLHLINFSDMKGSGSNIELSQPQLPIEVSLTLDGIGGLSVGNLFKVDYLPKVYREFCYDGNSHCYVLILFLNELYILSDILA